MIQFIDGKTVFNKSCTSIDYEIISNIKKQKARVESFGVKKVEIE
jgi:hypothetical protein